MIEPTKSPCSQYALQMDEEVSKNPIAQANFLSRLYFFWLQPIISLGYSRPLEEADIYPLPSYDQCDHLFQLYETSQKQQMHKGKLSDFVFGILYTIKKHVFHSLVSYGVYLLCTSLQPFLVQAILDYLEGKPNNISDNGAVLVVIMFASSFIAVSALEGGFFNLAYAGVNARSTTMDILYQKSLRLSSNASNNRGEIVTLMSVDSNRVFESCRVCPWVFIGPIVFILTHVLIAIFFDALTSVAGFGMLIGTILTSFYIADIISKARMELVAATQERIRLSSEILQGIRIIKLYAWEDAMYEKIELIRQKEIKLLRWMHFWKVFNKAFLFLSPLILSGTMLTVYICLGNSINVPKAFTLLACMNISRLGFLFFPQAVAMLSELRVSVKRINSYLNYDEVSELPPTLLKQQSHIEYITPSIKFNGASFAFPSNIEQQDVPSNSFNLRNIDVEIEAGSLTIIVGSVGSGKTSLINSILGEMVLTEGEMEVHGNIAYVGQEPWIRNTTIRENILFEEEYNEERYKAVLNASQLRPDLKIQPAGDQTEIGERGINLSGGQKARVSLARAFYACHQSKCDILLLDDVLSAVDAHVAKSLFTEGIKGIAKQKTRVLVLNSHYQFLQDADRVLVISNGEIVGDGTFDQLKLLPEFAHLNSSTVNEEVQQEHRDDRDSNMIECERLSELSRLSTVASCVNDELIKKEDREKGDITYETYISFFKLSGLNGWIVVLILLLLFGCGQVFRTLTDLWHGEWSDHEQSTAESDTLKDGIIFLVLTLLTIIFVVASVVAFIFFGLRCSHKLHNLAFRNVLRAPVNSFFDITPLGRIVNRFTADLDAVDSALQQFGSRFVQETFLVFSVLVICVVAAWYIVLIYMPVFVLFYFIGKYFLKSSTEIKRLDGITRSPIFSSFSDTLNGVQIIRAFKKQSEFNRFNRAHVDKNSSFLFAFYSSGYWLAIRLDLLTVALITIVSTVLVLTKGHVDESIAGITLVYSLSLTSMLQMCIRLWNLTESSMTSAERIMHYHHIESEATEISEDLSSIPNWPNKGDIEFQDLSMRYRPELKLVLKGINVSIRGGQKIGICGRTGAGKSSLMIALFRIAEFDHGTILIDGVDISKLGLKDLRKNLSIIPQDPILFSGSLRDNLDPFHTSTDEDICDSLRRVHLWDFVATSLDGDLDFVLSERGENLSLGQRQLVCIARAILRRNQIIVMDEATANVDITTDALIQTTIREVFTQQTILTIAHRLETILDSDRILLLDDGRVAEFDSPQLLLAKPNGLFRALAQDADLLS